MSAFAVGDRVTLQPPRWHDGSPVVDWPVPREVGYIEVFEECAGGHYARVNYTQKRGMGGHSLRNWERVDALHMVERYPVGLTAEVRS